MPANPVVCAVCGAEPAAAITVRRHVGMLIMQRFYKIQTPLCRQHGRELALQWLGRTLIQGWWGYISFFVNIFDVGTDVVAFIRFSLLPPPMKLPTR
jgi:hypothetical protein